MRKPAAIFFLFIFLGTTTEFGQLLKFPKFIAHYIKHRHEAPDLSMISFIQMHYNEWDVHDSDYTEDMQLPFKTQDTFTAGINLSPVIVPFNDFISPRVYYVNRVTYAVKDDDCISSSYKGSIFQPPRA